MKNLSAATLITAGLLVTAGKSQDQPVLQHMLSHNADTGQNASLAASNISREGEPLHSLFHLKGNVEIKAPFCVPQGKHRPLQTS
jgi:hypothetical protein